MGMCTVITRLDRLTTSEIQRVDLRARHIYRGLPPLIEWDDAGESTRSEFRRRAMRLMLFDGSLLSGVDPTGEDFGLAELQELEAEAWAVIRREVGPGDIWSASPSEVSGNGVVVADGDEGAVTDGGN